MSHIRKPPVDGPSIDLGPWTAARFQTELARDGFVSSIAAKHDEGWGAEVMTDDGLGAQVRWRQGRFLGLNDVAYAFGGKIVINSLQRRLVLRPRRRE